MVLRILLWLLLFVPQDGCFAGGHLVVAEVKSLHVSSQCTSRRAYHIPDIHLQISHVAHSIFKYQTRRAYHTPNILSKYPSPNITRRAYHTPNTFVGYLFTTTSNNAAFQPLPPPLYPPLHLYPPLPPCSPLVIPKSPVLPA